jgi:hypothetical protein
MSERRDRRMQDRRRLFPKQVSSEVIAQGKVQPVTPPVSLRGRQASLPPLSGLASALDGRANDFAPADCRRVNLHSLVATQQFASQFYPPQESSVDM